MSKGEDKIEKILRQYHIKYKREYILNGVKRKKPLRYDFALFNNYNQLLCLIEFNGLQHYTQIKQFQPNKTDFTKQQEYDRIKISACLARNIPLYEIPFNEETNINTLTDLINPKFLAKSKWHNDEIARKLKQQRLIK